MIDFREIRVRVPAQDAVRFYGATFDRRGWALCPFHGDTHPSVSFKGGRFRCWSCGASGDALDYVSRLFDLDMVRAAAKLNADFCLGLEPTEDNEAIRRAEAERRKLVALHERFEAWRKTTIDRLNSVCYLANAALNRGPDFTPQEISAIRYATLAEYFAEQLDGTPEEQAAVYRQRKEVERWIEQVLEIC